MTLIIHIDDLDDLGNIIWIKEAVASRLEDLGGVRVVDVKVDEKVKTVDEWRQETLWQSGKST